MLTTSLLLLVPDAPEVLSLDEDELSSVEVVEPLDDVVLVDEAVLVDEVVLLEDEVASTDELSVLAWEDDAIGGGGGGGIIAASTSPDDASVELDDVPSVELLASGDVDCEVESIGGGGGAVISPLAFPNCS